MSLQLKLGTDPTRFEIAGESYAKDSVTVQYLPDGSSINLYYNGQSLYENQVYSDIVDGDDSDTPFASMAALRGYINANFYRLYPYAKPVKYTSLGTTNAKTFKEGEALLHSLSVVNTNASDRYVKVYDMDSPPLDTDTPVLVFAVPQGTTGNLIVSSLALTYGLSIRITAGIADTDNTDIGAGDVVLNMQYQ